MSDAPSPDLIFPDVETGLKFLAALPLTNPVLAEVRLIQFLAAVQRQPLPAKDLFSLLEHARVQVGFVEEETSRRYCGKVLPLEDKEELAFQQVIAVWSGLEQAYALCRGLEQPDPNNPTYARTMATLLHRCLHCCGMVVLEHYRARRELPEGIWLKLHGYYQTAEKWGIAATPVLDELENPLQSSHCTAAYVTSLLVDIASPYSHSVKNINAIRRWASLWAPLVSIHLLEDDEELPSYLVELMYDAPLHQAGSANDPGVDSRCLDTTRLGLQINHMLSQLHQKISPSQLGLGEESNFIAINLLSRLMKPWTQSASPRRFRRFLAAGSVKVAVGFEAMHINISQKDSGQSGSAEPHLKTEFDQLLDFVTSPTLALRQEIKNKSPSDFPLHEWSIINHSANGFRLASNNSNTKISHAQLMAVLPNDGEYFLLFRTSWLMQERDSSLMAGLAMLPGIPTALQVRHSNVREVFFPGFLIPPVPAMKEESSLILPLGMFLSRGVLEILVNNENLQLRMLNVIERGMDYERISYEPA